MGGPASRCGRRAEDVAVGDNMVIGRGIGYPQTLGSELAAAGLDVDPDAMYLKKLHGAANPLVSARASCNDSSRSPPPFGTTNHNRPGTARSLIAYDH